MVGWSPHVFKWPSVLINCNVLLILYTRFMAPKVMNLLFPNIQFKEKQEVKPKWEMSRKQYNDIMEFGLLTVKGIAWHFGKYVYSLEVRYHSHMCPTNMKLWPGDHSLALGLKTAGLAVFKANQHLVCLFRTKIYKTVDRRRLHV